MGSDQLVDIKQEIIDEYSSPILLEEQHDEEMEVRIHGDIIICRNKVQSTRLY